jgi:hypothetical protein
MRPTRTEHRAAATLVFRATISAADAAARAPDGTPAQGIAAAYAGLARASESRRLGGAWAGLGKRVCPVRAGGPLAVHMAIASYLLVEQLVVRVH